MMHQYLQGVTLLAGMLFQAAGSTDSQDRPERVQTGLPERSFDVGQTRTSTRGRPLLELSVEQAAVLALRNNRDLRVREFAPVIAGTFERIERGRFEPELFAEGSFFQENASQVARATEEQFDVQGRSTDVRVGVRKLFATGTELEAVVRHEYDDSDRTPEQQQATVGLTVTQALLRGLGPAVNLASVRQAELEEVASTHELRAFVESLLARTETAYWDFVRATKEIEVFESSVEVGRRELGEIEGRIAVGTTPELRAAPARAEVARQQQALIDAEARLEAARLRLVRLVNPGNRGRLNGSVVATSRPRIRPNPLGSVRDRIRLAERNRPELSEAQLRLEQDRLQVVVTRNGLLPQLDLFVSLAKTGFEDTATGAFGALGQPTYEVRTGLSLSHALSNRAAGAAKTQAEATRAQRVAAIENLRQVVRLDVRLAVNEAQRAAAQISASATTRALRAETFRAEKERLEVGAGTALAVAQAQRDLLASRIDEVRAVVDYRQALVNLYLAEGTLLARRGVTVEPVGP
jgi:outer membrane protein TolC